MDGQDIYHYRVANSYTQRQDYSGVVRRVRGRLRWTIFWTLVGIFVVIAGGFLIPALRELLFRGFPFFIIFWVVFSLLGVALVVLTVRERVGGKLKAFLILTGTSAAGFVVSILLHNTIYGLFIYWFGGDFWDRIGLEDEPVFFFIAIFGCPIGFPVGAVGSIVLAMRKRSIAVT